MKVNPDFKSQCATWWLSNKQLTIKVEIDDNSNIKTAAPVVYKFIGQPLSNLIRWMNSMGKTEVNKIN